MTFYLQVYCLGTILSMQIPFVGFQPVQSSEHMAVCYECCYRDCGFQLINYGLASCHCSNLCFTSFESMYIMYVIALNKPANVTMVM